MCSMLYGLDSCTPSTIGLFRSFPGYLGNWLLRQEFLGLEAHRAEMLAHSKPQPKAKIKYLVTEIPRQIKKIVQANIDRLSQI